MKMQKRQFRIGELSKTLQVEQFVIRFWEKEFEVTSFRSEGGQRFYTEKDLTRFQAIKQLLYEEGFTIAGAKKQLHALSPAKIAAKVKPHESFVPASQEASFEELSIANKSITQDAPNHQEPIRSNEKLKAVREKLIQLQAIL